MMPAGSALWVRTESVAWRFLVGLALAKLTVHLLSNVALTYGYMSDELYYLDCANHLDWGYVDHPPFSIAALWVMRAVFGDSLVALRLLPAVAGGVTIVLVGLMARELGGGRVAQGLAGLAALVSPVYLAVGGFYSMNAFELPIWALCAYLLLRILNDGGHYHWLVLGVVLGIGLLNKISSLWLGLGLLVGLLLTPQRRWLRTPWPWLTAAIAIVLFAPHVLWQVSHGWPTLEFMRNATQHKMIAKSPLTYLGEQVLIMHPLALPLWLAGLGYYFVARRATTHRVLGWIWVTVFLLLIASGRARSNYMAPAYVVLLPAGGLVIERFASARSWEWLPPAVAGALTLGGIATAPMAIDLLPPVQYMAYERRVGLSAPTDQIDALGAMPLHFALRFGWREYTQTVAAVYATLPADEQRRVGILVETFGEAGALNFFGPVARLPLAVSTHNNYWLWGPDGYSGEVMLVVADASSPLLQIFGHVERAAPIRCDYCLPQLTTKSVYICRHPSRPLLDLWAELKSYV